MLTELRCCSEDQRGRGGEGGQAGGGGGGEPRVLLSADKKKPREVSIHVLNLTEMFLSTETHD